jgi:hypothetical protein
MAQDQWHSQARRLLDKFGLPLAQIGIHLYGLILHAPAQSGTTARLQLQSWLAHAPQTAALTGGDLPLGLSAEDVAVATEVFSGKTVSALTDHQFNQLGARCWVDASVFIFNSMWSEPQSSSFTEMPDFPWPGFMYDRVLPSQVKALRLISDLIDDFLATADGEPQQTISMNWSEELRRKRVDYQGHIVSQAVAFTWCQLEPGLPEVGPSVRVDVMDLADGPMREALQHPSSVLLPQAEWPASFDNTRVMSVTDSEWELACQGFFARHLIRRLDRTKLIRDSEGKPLGSGVMGVGTGKIVPDFEQLEILRTVFNLPPSNCLQAPILGDVATLPYSGLWQGLVVDDPTLLRWHSEDMISRFFLLRLPPEWSYVFALSKEAPGWTVNCPLEESVPIGLTIVPPGWLSANGVIQYLHRQLIKKSFSLPPGLELRKDKARPTNADFATPSFYCIYVDNCDGAQSSLDQSQHDFTRYFLEVTKTGGSDLSLR